MSGPVRGDLAPLPLVVEVAPVALLQHQLLAVRVDTETAAQLAVLQLAGLATEAPRPRHLQSE